MPYTVRHFTQYLEALAPPTYQANYDNTGLQVGDPAAEVAGVLIALDPTEAVLNEAIEKGCNLLITHHPLLFRPVQKITPADPTTRTLLYAVQRGVHIYALHTNFDHVAIGINRTLGEALGLQDLRILSPLPETHYLLTTFLPPADLETVRNALFQAGAGEFAPYKKCSFTSLGTATFHPTLEAKPHLGQKEETHHLEEVCLRTLVPAHHKDQILHALVQVHPYETPVYFLTSLTQKQSALGAGMIGELKDPLSPYTFLEHIKKKLSLPYLRYTNPPRPTIQRVALCGGSGSQLLPHAYQAQADAYLTADTKYHQFFAPEGKLMLVDIGHYESEISFKTLIHKLLSEKFADIALYPCTTSTNPIHYY